MLSCQRRKKKAAGNDLRNVLFCKILEVIDRWNRCRKQEVRSIYTCDGNGFPGGLGSVKHV